MKNCLVLGFLFLMVSNAFAQELFGLETSNIHKTRSKNLNTSSDPDVLKAISRGVLSNNNTHYTVITFKDELGASWILQVFENKLKEGPSFFVPHDSENDSFQVGIRAIMEFGGHLLALECKEDRRCKKGIDPNRYFKSGKS